MIKVKQQNNNKKKYNKKILKDGKVVSGIRNVQINYHFAMPLLNLTERCYKKIYAENSIKSIMKLYYQHKI